MRVEQLLVISELLLNGPDGRGQVGLSGYSETGEDAEKHGMQQQ